MKSLSLTYSCLSDAFGRVPIHDRQWTQHILALPASACSAGTGGAVTTFYGPCYIPSVFVHELTHTLDAYVNDQTGSTGSVHVYSTTSSYLNSVNQDSCVPDGYANNCNSSNILVLSPFCGY